jgi:Histidine kinase-, DNA gyrase B-, and HSP90-like ATPase
MPGWRADEVARRARLRLTKAEYETMTASGSASQAQIAAAEDSYSPDAPLYLYYGGSIVVQLGSQLYPSVTATVAELVSNAWDADARNVWVSVPLGEDWEGTDSTIEVLDDGSGMDRRDAQFKYLIVGRERRVKENTDKTPAGRPLHGRKGIGKLAAFGTGRELEVVTQREGCEPVGFRLDYEDLKKHEPGQSTRVEEFKAEPLFDPDGRRLAHGTRVRLTKLQAKRRPSASRFMLSMRRRFSLDAAQMKVLVNGAPLKRFDADFQYRFPRDGHPPGVDAVDDDGLAVDFVDCGEDGKKEVRWWVGFMEKPVDDEILQGVSVLVRGKQAQRPFKFERTRGTEGQLGFEYMVGEVHADWIDDGLEEDLDLIASNRDTLQLENERLQPFVAWGRRLLVWALAERNKLQHERRSQRWSQEMPGVEAVLERAKARERRALGRVAERLSRVEGIEDTDVAEVMQRVLDVREHRAAEAIAQELRATGDPASERTWEMIDDAIALERRTARPIVSARLALLQLLQETLHDGDDLPDLQQVLASSPWLVDLRFDRSAARPLELAGAPCQALVLLGPPAWDPDARSTLLAAMWDKAGREPSGKDWWEGLDDQAESHSATLLLISRTRVEADASTTWAEALDLSRRQHEAWLALLEDRPS